MQIRLYLKAYGDPPQYFISGVRCRVCYEIG